MLKYAILLVLVALAHTATTGEGKNGAELQQEPCIIDVTVNADQQPLVVNANFSFPRPTDLGNPSIEFAPGAQFWIACPGGEFTDDLNANGELMTCQGDTNITTTNGQVFDYNTILCNQNETGIPILYDYIHNSEGCEGGNTLIDVGYVIDITFLPVHSICFDIDTLTPLYTKEKLTPWAALSKIPGPNAFVVSTIYGEINIENLYVNINNALAYLGFDSDNILTKGQLAPSGDFLYKSQKDATFYYPNVAPQWKSINEGNWAIVNEVIANLTYQNATDAVVINGVLNVLNVKQNGVMAPLYLLPGTLQIPVPEFFWKLVYYPEELKELFFFGLNHPNPDAELLGKFTEEICGEDLFSIHQHAWGLDAVNNNDSSLGIIYICNGYYLNDPLIKEIAKNEERKMYGVTPSEVSG
ncbi:hypothetical protein Zmor_019054 [Zophobas morio]|uniref:DNA/RNA non-specific endonuclease/pyrophosphatase/phosphodiesterase domain-containing protein n=1 Tax=Zophobas morio TaxID=2755281 RepID=A0AA38IB15_9CUCU|nr:hypothetical protein Zmor_019054 [Zophobas morio]